MDKKSIIKLASIFLEASEKEDTEIVVILKERGIKLDKAERFVAFLPIAFGRVVINRLGQVKFSNVYRIKGIAAEFCLDKEPIFNEAYNIATESYLANVIPRENFSAIAGRSPELNAVSKALDEGADINGAEFQPVLLFGYKTIGKQGLFRRIFG
jgi:hypothetical protein